MKYFILVLIGLFSYHSIVSQELSGEELLDKAITYHDPNNQWNTFSGEFDIVMEMPGKSERVSHITINLPNDYFKVTAKRDSIVTEYVLEKGECTLSLNGKSELSKAELFSNNLSCDRATMYRDYYTYLYGLPMKLKDEGTIISKDIERKKFKSKDYLVLKVAYDEAVGNDIWYFYFHPETYALEIYQFFKTDEEGNIKHDSGEFIMLSEYETINQIKMPKVRAWYYNKDGSYLATDVLKTE